MKRSIVWALVASMCLVAAGCSSTRQTQIQDALDAVQAAHDAAHQSLGDEPVAAGALAILDVALQGYHHASARDDGTADSWQWYFNWARLAAKAVVAVIDILEGSGVDVPGAVMVARDALRPYL